MRGESLFEENRATWLEQLLHPSRIGKVDNLLTSLQLHQSGELI